jgi:hypothetical protein
MPNRNRIGSFVWALACVLAVPSCHDNGPFDPLADVVGDYTLTTANGQLPLRYFHTDASGQTTVDIVSGTLRLSRTGSFQEVLQYHVIPPSGAPSDPSATTSGTFALDGANITFIQLSQTGSYSWGGIVGDGTITYTDPAFVDAGGLTAVYSR